MKSATVTLIALLTLSLTGGCATSAVSFSDYSASLAPVPSSQGRVFFYRVTSGGRSIRPDVRLNDQVVGRALPDTFFHVDRDPGTYTVSSRSNARRTMSLNLRRGEEVYIRVSVRMTPSSWDVSLTRVPAEVALEEMQRTKAGG